MVYASQRFISLSLLRSLGWDVQGQYRTPSIELGSKVLLSYFSVVISMRLLFHGPYGGSSLRPQSHDPTVGRERVEKEAPLL